ncbi:MAG: E3 binding domain-containing protein, partial [Ignavibacteriales bacterium]|nr:E3 binding domain-containing protein [Ignavibacteriales bacterium]
MATKITMPKLSDTMDQGVILKWLRKEGEKVKQGETLVEIESDKADMELEAYDTGVLRKIVVPEGGKAPIGALIAIIGKPEEDISALLADTGVAASSALPKEQSEKKPNEAGQPAVAAPQVVTVLAPVAITPASPTDGRTKASPLAKRIAAENQISLQSIHGSGAQGRVIKRDLEDVLSGKAPVAARVQSFAPGTSEDVELSPIRKTIAKRMTESKLSAPHFYVTVEIDMEPAMAFREQLNAASEI